MRRTVVVCEGPAVPSSPWPARADDLLLRDPVEADVEALLAFRNDPVVNHFMVRTHVDPDTMDPSVRPQDDLFRHVNGGWLARHVIPPTGRGTAPSAPCTTRRRSRCETSFSTPRRRPREPLPRPGPRTGTGTARARGRLLTPGEPA